MAGAALLEVRHLVFSSGERFPAVVNGATGIPDYDATLYCLTQLRARNLSASTLTSAVRAIMFGYQALELIGVSLDGRLANGRLFDLGEIGRLADCFSKTQAQIRGMLNKAVQPTARRRLNSLESFRKSAAVQNHNSMISPDTAAMRLLYFRDFIKWKVQGKLLSLSSAEQDHIALFHALEFAVGAINARMPKSAARSDLETRQGLSEREIQQLLEITELKSPLNPWKAESVRVRNRLIVQTLLNLGLRKGELLGLKVMDINFRSNELTIHRRADDIRDPRSIQPNAKTSARILALDPELSRGLHLYILKHREAARRAKFHPFLFVSNGNGSPMSISALDSIFTDIKDAASTKFEMLSPHILRHTWNDRFSEIMDEAGVDEGKENEARSYAMGWKSGSTTAATYTRRHIRKKANEASLQLQKRFVKLKGDD